MDDDDESDAEFLKKARRLSDMPDPAASMDENNVEISEEERRRILQMVEDEPEAEPLDGNTLKKLILAFEKRVLKNQELRIKFPDLPEKSVYVFFICASSIYSCI